MRGLLMDALEDKFTFFFNRAILCAFRDLALKSFISTIREEFKTRSDLYLNESSCKRARYDDYTTYETLVMKMKKSQATKKIQLAYG